MTTRCASGCSGLSSPGCSRSFAHRVDVSPRAHKSSPCPLGVGKAQAARAACNERNASVERKQRFTGSQNLSASWQIDLRSFARVPVSRKVRSGSKPENLNASICFPLCPQERTWSDHCGMNAVRIADIFQHLPPERPAAAREGTHHHCDENRTSKVPF